jgi:hypothetical protein
MVRSSRLAHDGSTLLPGVSDPGVSRAPFATVLICTSWSLPLCSLTASRRIRTAAVSSGPWTRSARGNAERRSARSRHSGAGCSQAPRPESRRRGSGVRTPFTATTLSRPSAADRTRHPMHVRTGPATDRRSGAGVGRAGAEPELWAGVECSAASVRASPALRAVSILTPPSVCVRALSRPTPTRRRRRPHGGRRRCGCRSASRSAGRRGGRSGPPCRWPATAGSPAPRRGRSSCARPGQ